MIRPVVPGAGVGASARCSTRSRGSGSMMESGIEPSGTPSAARYSSSAPRSAPPPSRERKYAVRLHRPAQVEPLAVLGIQAIGHGARLGRRGILGFPPRSSPPGSGVRDPACRSRCDPARRASPWSIPPRAKAPPCAGVRGTAVPSTPEVGTVLRSLPDTCLLPSPAMIAHVVKS